MRASFILFALFAFAPGWAAAQVPRRIIPLLPSLAEIAVDILGSDERIAGVSEYSDFPLSLKKKTSIGPFSKPNLETIISLKPDLVLASSDGSPPAVVARLRKLGFSVLSVGTDSIEKVRASYTSLGEAFEKKKEASAAVARFDAEIASIRDRAKKRAESAAPGRMKSVGTDPEKISPLRVLIQVGDEPLYVAGGASFLNEALVILGVKNVFADAPLAYPHASVEDILRRDPEVILLVSLGDDLKPFERARKKWEAYPTLAATKNRRILISRSDSLVRPGPRLPGGLRDLERLLFPDRTLPGGGKP